MELAVDFARASELRQAAEGAKARVEEMREQMKLVEKQNKPLDDLYR